MPARVADAARAELEVLAAEAEERGTQEDAAGIGIELIPGAVDPEVVVAPEAVLVSQEHAPDRECAEAELRGLENLAGAAHRTTPVMETELRLDDEDLRALLLLLEQSEALDRALALLELVRAAFAFAVVHETSVVGLRELLEHQLNRLTVGGSDGLPVRDSGVALGEAHEGRVERRLIGHDLATKLRAQDLALLREEDGRAVAREVAVLRRHLLTNELVRDRELLDQGDDPVSKLPAVLDEALESVLVDVRRSERLVGGIRDESSVLLPLIFREAERDRHGHHHRTLLLPTIAGRRTNNYFDETYVL